MKFESVQKCIDISALFSKTEKWQFFFMTLFATATALLEIATAFSVALLARVLTQPDSLNILLKRFVHLTLTLSPQTAILGIMLSCLCLYIIKSISALIESFYQQHVIQKTKVALSLRLLDLYTKAPYEYYLKQNTSEGLTLFSVDLERVFYAGINGLCTILSEGIIFICLISALMVINPLSSLVTFGAGGLLIILLIKILLPKFYKWGQNVQESSQSAEQHLLQFFHGFKEMVLLNKSTPFIEQYGHYIHRASHNRARYLATNIIPRLVLEVFFILIITLLIFYLTLSGFSSTHIITLLGGYLYIGFRLLPGTNRILTNLNMFKAVLPHFEHVLNEYQKLTQATQSLSSPRLTFATTIDIRNITYTYPGASIPVIEGLSLSISQGESIGIIGETGSGKSTLTDLILGLIVPQSGKIMIDKKYPPNCPQWQAKIGYVPQTLYLTDDTIAANIAFGDSPENFDLERLNFALQQAQLTDFIARLPQGIHTLVGDRGIRLSGGERQRVGIARALYRNPELLIFDEATSALDSNTERTLIETIRPLSKTRTILMVAHRLTTLKYCDRIVVMNKGKIQKIVTYSELYPA